MTGAAISARTGLALMAAVCLAAPGMAEEQAPTRAAAQEILARCLALPEGAATFVDDLEAAGWTRRPEATLATFAAEVALAFMFDPEEPAETSARALFTAAMLGGPGLAGAGLVLERDGIAVGPFGLDQPRALCAISGPEALAEAARAMVELTDMQARSVPGLLVRAGSQRVTLAILDAPAFAAQVADHLPDAIGGSALFGIDTAYVQIISPGKGG